MLELLDRVGDLEEDVLAHVELDQLRERGERRRDGVHVVVRQVQGPQLLNRKLYFSASALSSHFLLTGFDGGSTYIYRATILAGKTSS